MKEMSLKEQVQQALKLAQRASDYMEIQNVMARHVYYNYAGKTGEELEAIWAKNVPDIAYGHNHAFQVGQESLRDYYGGTNERGRKGKLEIMSMLYPDVNNVKENEGIGDLIMRPISTPCIEIAKDGKTAKGIWFSNSMNAEIGTDGKPIFFTFWGKFGVDFIKEDGKWKIWHLLKIDDIIYRHEQSWVDKINAPIGFDHPVKEDEKHQKPDMLRKVPHQMYSNKTVPQNDPKPPEPYETWDESISYLK